MCGSCLLHYMAEQYPDEQFGARELYGKFRGCSGALRDRDHGSKSNYRGFASDRDLLICDDARILDAASEGLEKV